MSTPQFSFGNAALTSGANTSPEDEALNGNHAKRKKFYLQENQKLQGDLHPVAPFIHLTYPQAPTALMAACGLSERPMVTT